MFTPLQTLEVMALRYAIKGFGTDEELLVEILANKSNEEIATLKQAYETEYKRDLEIDIDEDTSGDVRRFFVALINRPRGKTGTASTVEADVDALYASGIGRRGTLQYVFTRMLASKSYEHLFAVSEGFVVSIYCSI
jgi:hypothetical protein